MAKIENMNDIGRLLAKICVRIVNNPKVCSIIPFVGIDPIGSAMGTIVGTLFTTQSLALSTISDNGLLDCQIECRTIG